MDVVLKPDLIIRQSTAPPRAAPVFPL